MKSLNIAALIGLFLVTHGNVVAEDKVEYTAAFEGFWTEDTHPKEYPQSTLIGGPHFSGLIGATHNRNFTLFTPGGTASPGLERLSEMGKHDPLDDEIRAAMKDGTVGELIESDPIRKLPGRVEATFPVDIEHPYVSLAAMIAPSPDWFTGATDIELYSNGKWADTKTVVFYAWDAGTDDGVTYSANDRDAKPKKSIAINDSSHFIVAGNRVPVGILTLTKN